MVNQVQIKHFRYSTLSKIKTITNGKDGILCYCDETETFYVYRSSAGALSANDKDVVTTGAGGDTRWIGISGKYIYFDNVITRNTIEDSYYEITKIGGVVSNECWYTTPAKTTKIREISYTRVGGLVTQISTMQYDNGVLYKTYTEVITRVGGVVTSIIGTLT